jgi:hypothetical protein
MAATTNAELVLARVSGAGGLGADSGDVGSATTWHIQPLRTRSMPLNSMMRRIGGSARIGEVYPSSVAEQPYRSTGRSMALYQGLVQSQGWNRWTLVLRAMTSPAPELRAIRMRPRQTSAPATRNTGILFAQLDCVVVRRCESLVAHESWRGSSVEVGQLEGSAAHRVVCDENASGRDSRNARLASVSADEAHRPSWTRGRRRFSGAPAALAPGAKQRATWNVGVCGRREIHVQATDPLKPGKTAA